MSSEAHVVLEQYRAAVKAAESLKGQVFDLYKALPTLEEKFRFVLDNGSDFLKEENWYCPHVRTSEGEVSMYDDLYWERRETNDIDVLYEMILDNMEFAEDDESDYDDMLANRYVEMLNQDSPPAAVLRDMLKQGIGRATHDW
ncbi:hypothetical protein D3C75_554830 [compost metagenome]